MALLNKFCTIFIPIKSLIIIDFENLEVNFIYIWLRVKFMSILTAMADNSPRFDAPF